MDYHLCAALQKKYSDDKIRQLINLYVDADRFCRESRQIIDDLDKKIMILEAENRILKKNPVDAHCGYEHCGPHGSCICYTR